MKTALSSREFFVFEVLRVNESQAWEPKEFVNRAKRDVKKGAMAKAIRGKCLARLPNVPQIPGFRKIRAE